MSAQSEPEISGNLFTHPFAELIAEFAGIGVSGSLCVDDKDRKSIIYFKDGRIVFAVSNARSARLFQIILDQGRLAEQELTDAPAIGNDMDLAAHLERKGLLSKDDTAGLFTVQLERIIVDLLSWNDGNWSFSPLRRVKDGLDFNVDTPKLLMDYGRCLDPDKVLGRFRSFEEKFSRAPDTTIALGQNLTPEEAFILSRLIENGIAIAGIVTMTGLSETKVMHALYDLWLGGLVNREDWKPALSRDVVKALKGARLALKREAKHLEVPVAPKVVSKPAEPHASAEAELDVNAYLARVEGAETYYDVLGIDSRADLTTIKNAYLSVAKNFHPDKYHSGEVTLLKRVLDAFAAVMQANETLKNNESRGLYDYRMRKELAAREASKTSGSTEAQIHEADHSAENFEHGFSLLMDSNQEAAVPYLARAVHYAPAVARYHAYYGKALSSDATQRHKAESELQAAVKLDPHDPSFRIFLAEFFIQFNLLKRAEGELNRLLAVFPSNREAHELLAELQKPARQ